jgi:hypothetical protein
MLGIPFEKSWQGHVFLALVSGSVAGAVWGLVALIQGVP